jgi:hypothetical protein
MCDAWTFNYTWCEHRPGNGDIHLFDGGEQNKRFYKQLCNALKEIPLHQHQYLR